MAGGYDEVSRDRDRRVDDRVEKIARELLEFSEGERGQIVLDVLSQLKLTESAPLPASTPRAPGAVILANRLGRELLALAEDERTMVAFRLLARMGWVEKKGLPASTGWMDSGSSTRKTSRIGPLILAMLSAIAGAVFFGVQQHATRPQSSVTAPNDPPRAQSAPATREPSVDTGFEITSDPPGREVWIDGEPINGPRDRANRLPGDESSGGHPSIGASGGRRVSHLAARHRRPGRIHRQGPRGARSGALQGWCTSWVAGQVARGVTTNGYRRTDALGIAAAILLPRGCRVGSEQGSPRR